MDVQDGKVCGVFTNLHGYYACKAVVIATGTNLAGAFLWATPTMTAAPTAPMPPPR